MPGIALLALLSSLAPLPYLDPSLPAPQRAADLVSRMTLEEKISQMQNVAVAIPRLGIPAYDWWSEALHGAVGSPVTVYPQVIGLAGTFDRDLIRDIGTAISDEGRARYAAAIRHGRTGMHEGLTFWAPNINIFRDPRWGRGQETYGEDPFLTSRMAVEYVTAMQSERGGKLKAVSTPKHYAVHSGPDPMRHRFDARPDPRDLWNTYLPAFKACVTDADAWSVMSAYSSFNGIPDSANKTLLQEFLRDRWGFRGYVVSDCGAIYDIMSGHHYANNLAEAAADGVNAGCDLECGDAYKHLGEAVKLGLTTEATIDKSVKRLFEARIRLGMFDPAGKGPWDHLDMSVVDSPAHRALALKAARESVVLLKNDGFLPLNGVHRLAVIGPNADDRYVPLGNYNGMPSHTVTVVEGLKEVAPPGTVIEYTQGSARTEGLNVTPVPASALPGGVHAVFFNGDRMEGPPLLTRDTPQLDFDWDDSAPDPKVPQTNFSARFTATLVPPKTGTYSLGTRTDDGGRLILDGKTIEEDWNDHAARSSTVPVHLEAGRSYQVVVEFFQHGGQSSASLVWAPPGGDDFGDAVALASRSDAVVMVLGISGEIENEENDRISIELPKIQQRLLDAVLATGKPVVVVLESGSCIALDPSRLRGLVEAWYPGQAGGTAVAEVLFGKTNPSGRLPVTFYKSLAQVPPFEDYKMEDRTYRYLTQKPLYPFGYGLSYTRFAYSDAQVAPETNGDLAVAARVRNTGTVPGEEVVQVYSARDNAAWPEPLRKLVAFTRVYLSPGESRRLTLHVSRAALAQADANGHLAVLSGTYRISVGGGQPGQEPPTSGRSAVARIRHG